MVASLEARTALSSAATNSHRFQPFSCSSFDTRAVKRSLASKIVLNLKAGFNGRESKRTFSQRPRSLVRSFAKGSNSGSLDSSIIESRKDEPLQSVSLVEEGVSVEGVAKVDREDGPPQSTWGRIGLLVGGDVVALLLFASIGRLSHGLSAFDWDAVRTADPFIAGWLLGAYFLGGYGPEGQGLKGLRSVALSTVKSWAVGVPLGLIIRGISIGLVPPQPFILVSLGSILVLQVGWRTALTGLFPNDVKSYQKRKGDRNGSFLEFFELLTSLVKRW